MKAIQLFVFILLTCSLSAQTDFQFDVSKIPFSSYGSYLSFSTCERRGNAENSLYLYDVSGEKIWQWNGLYKFEPIDSEGKTLTYKIIATPSLLTLQTESGKISICFENPNAIRIKLEGVAMKITSAVEGRERLIRIDGPNRWRMMGNPRFAFSLLRGNLSMQEHQKMTIEPHSQATIFSTDTTKTHFNCIDPLIVTPDKSNQAEIVMERYVTEWIPVNYETSFTQCVENQKLVFLKWVERLPAVSENYTNSMKQAAYCQWSAVVAPFDCMPRYGVLMSKNWMYNIWAWDHCFTALSLIDFQPSLAWDQMMIPFDHQDSLGALPDYTNSKHLSRSMTKLPVHGWAIAKMMNSKNPLTTNQLKEIYPKLVKWTNFWLIHRNSKNGFPQVFEWFDIGWDNGSVFDTGCPVEAPDLCAFLVIQAETLSKIALKLGKNEEAAEWQKKSIDLLNRTINYFWTGEQFVNKRLTDGKWNPNSKSLYNYLPLVLGNRLPANIRNKMIADLKNKDGFLSPYGLITELPSSEYYTTDGYWRGPIWTPTTWLILDGIDNAGDHEFAKEIAKRLCDVINREGFYENFDAKTGAGLRDPAYTWTSGVFMNLTSTYFNK
jgi:putative isomerase